MKYWTFCLSLASLAVQISLNHVRNPLEIINIAQDMCLVWEDDLPSRSVKSPGWWGLDGGLQDDNYRIPVSLQRQMGGNAGIWAHLNSLCGCVIISKRSKSGLYTPQQRLPALDKFLPTQLKPLLLVEDFKIGQWVKPRLVCTRKIRKIISCLFKKKRKCFTCQVDFPGWDTTWFFNEGRSNAPSS